MKVTTTSSLQYRHGYITTVSATGIHMVMYQKGKDVDSTDPALLEGGDYHPSLAGTKIKLLHEATVSFSEINSRPEQSDYAIWSLISREDRFGPVFNRIVETVDSKRHRDHNHRMNETSALKILVPLKSQDPANWVIHVACHTDYPLLCNVPVEELGLYETIAAYMPTMAAPAQAQVAPDGTISIEVTLTNVPANSDAEMYVTSNGGYWPLNRKSVSGNKATFKFKALGLESGDEIKAKFGLKHYSSLTETKIKIN